MAGLRALLERSKSAVLFSWHPSAPSTSAPSSTASTGGNSVHTATENDGDGNSNSAASPMASSASNGVARVQPTKLSSAVMRRGSSNGTSANSRVTTTTSAASSTTATRLGGLSAAAAARIHRLVGENPPMGSAARVVRRQYQSLIKERERALEDTDAALDAVALYEVEFPKPPAPSQPPATSQESDQLQRQRQQQQASPTSHHHGSLGIDLETDFYGRHAVVKEIKRGSVAFALSKTCLKPGHIVVAVNGRDLSQHDFAGVMAELRSAQAPRVIRFLDPSVLPVRELRHEPALVNRDQYGFAKDDRYILNYRRQLRKRKLASYEREREWTEFVQQQGGMDTIDRLIHDTAADPDALQARGAVLAELRALVLRGIPILLRPRLWSILAHVTPYKATYAADYYAQLVAQSEQSPWVGDIDKDICRTYPEHAFFQSEAGKRELKHVLCAYSLHDPSIGYCQSMNFIAGMMVLFMGEEDAFWLLCAMMQRAYLPADNYAQSMAGTQTDQLVFKQLVARELPEVAARLELCGIQIQLITLHWFLCAFVCTLPTESALRVWDWFFLDGQEVLFTTAIGILRLAQPRILGAKTHSDLHTVVRELGTDLHDDDALLYFLHGMVSAPPTVKVPSVRKQASVRSIRSDADTEEVESGTFDDDESDNDDDDAFSADGDLDDQGEDNNGEGEETRDRRYADATAAWSRSPSKPPPQPPSRRRKVALQAAPSKLQSMIKQLLDSQRKNAPVFQQQFTMADIDQMRAEFREQLATKSAPSQPLTL